MTALRAPFPYFGGKRKVAAEVWTRLGTVRNYVEPFFGSGAMLLARPSPEGIETVNDADGMVSNFWRAIKLSPDATAEHADWPVNENDLHARHHWLVRRKESLRASLEGDPEWHDPQAAGWWAWGMSCWIGGGFCSGNGPWGVDDSGQLVHLGNTGQGVNRKLVHLGDAGRGVKRQRENLRESFAALADRFRNVRVCSGDWSRVCGPSVTHKHGLTAVFLDPPYADTADRYGDLYAEDDTRVAHDVREWALEAGKREDMRIALCGYEGEHEMPDGWSVVAWNAGQGFGGQAEERTLNGRRERVWFSPACVRQPEQGQLFAGER